MAKYEYSKLEKEFNKFLKYHNDTLKSISSLEGELKILNDNIFFK